MSPLLEKIEQEIPQLKIEDQQKLLQDLPSLLTLSQNDILLLKSAEPSFDFWNNVEDSIYDNL